MYCRKKRNKSNIWVPVWSKEVTVSNEKNTKKNRKNILPFPADRGAGKCTFTSFLQETGRKICGKSERNRIYIRQKERKGFAALTIMKRHFCGGFV